MRSTHLLAFSASALLAVAAAAQQRRALSHDDYDDWKALQAVAYEPSGAWVAYQVQPEWGDGVLVVQEVDGARRYERPCGSGARFSADGRFVVFQVEDSKVAERDRKIAELRERARRMAAGEEPGKGKKKDEKKDEGSPLFVLELATGAQAALGAVTRWSMPDDVDVLAYVPFVAKEKGGGKDGQKEREATAEGEGEPEKEAAKDKPKDPLAKKRPQGSLLRLRDLASGEERVIANVVRYGWSRKGRWLWCHVSTKEPHEDIRDGLLVEQLADGARNWLLGGAVNVSDVTIDRDETAIAFLSDREQFGQDDAAKDLYLFDGASGVTRRVAFVGAEGMPPGKRVAGGLSFSRDGGALSFSVEDAPAPDPLPILPEDEVVLDIWHHRDGLLQTMQAKRRSRERLTAVYWRDEARVVVLGDDRTPTLSFVGADGRRMLGHDGQPYEQRISWDGRYADAWLVDGRTGARRRVVEELRGTVRCSPGGRYLLWFGADRRWWSMDCETGVRRDLTGRLAVPFDQHDDDHPAPADAYGVAGWTRDDGAVLLYDEFDLWKVSPENGEALCVTDGYGRERAVRLRRQALPRDDDSPWVEDELLLSAFDTETMATGYFADALHRAQRPVELVMCDAELGGLTRPQRSARLFFRKSTFRAFPDLWTSGADFREPRRLTDANPQQADVRWGNAELVRWVDGDGERRKGVLVKPDDFDPSKRYPMLVYFYERMSDRLHRYVPPTAGTSPNASYYVSNGYLWFMPDVHYEVGYPGESCVKCVVSGVQHLIAQGFVDAAAIGAAGHSWGGYQTAFLVTRTDIFQCVESGAPVSNMLSAYGGIRYGTGMSRQFQYEQTQSRIGGTPWQYPLRYQENSPIHFADKVRTPVLMLHNDQDGAVPWTQGVEFFVALRRLGKEAYLFNYNGEDHGLRKRQNKRDWTRRMQEYFDHHLKGRPAPKWMTDGVPYVERAAEKLPFAPSYIDAHVKPPKEAPAPAAPVEAAVEAAQQPAGEKASVVR